MGLGPGGQPIDANHLNKGIGMGNIGPAGEDYSVPQLGVLGEVKNYYNYIIIKIIGIIGPQIVQME